MTQRPSDPLHDVTDGALLAEVDRRIVARSRGMLAALEIANGLSDDPAAQRLFTAQVAAGLRANDIGRLTADELARLAAACQVAARADAAGGTSPAP